MLVSWESKEVLHTRTEDYCTSIHWRTVRQGVGLGLGLGLGLLINHG